MFVQSKRKPIEGFLEIHRQQRKAMDTVIIKIYGPRKFKVENTSWFLPELNSRVFPQLSRTEQQSTRLYLRHFVFHPPYQSGYLPKIEVFETLNKDRDAVVYILKAEFSVPKLLYGNSLQEVSDMDLEKTLYTFRRALGDVGIVIESETIANARVAAVHFCKNVPLPEDIRLQDILTELARTDISKVVDITKKEFKHGGQLLHIYSGTREWVFYDKVADAMRPKVKRKDKGRMGRERSIIERYDLENREVFRYEHRIKKAQTVWHDVNAALGRDAKKVVLFRDLFEPALCKTIVLNTWRALIQRPENQLALIGPTDGLGLLQHISAAARKQGKVNSMNQTFISYGLACAIRDHGAKEVRRVVSKGWNTDHPERLTKKIEAAAELTRGLPYSNAISLIDGALERYELTTPSSLQNAL